LAQRFHGKCMQHAGRTTGTVRELLRRGENRVWVIYSDGRSLESVQGELASMRLRESASQVVGHDGGGLVVAVTAERSRRRAQR
jgi:hypothetical protein